MHRHKQFRSCSQAQWICRTRARIIETNANKRCHCDISRSFVPETYVSHDDASLYMQRISRDDFVRFGSHTRNLASKISFLCLSFYTNSTKLHFVVAWHRYVLRTNSVVYFRKYARSYWEDLYIVWFHRRKVPAFIIQSISFNWAPFRGAFNNRYSPYIHAAFSKNNIFHDLMVHHLSKVYLREMRGRPPAASNAYFTSREVHISNALIWHLIILVKFEYFAKHWCFTMI